MSDVTKTGLKPFLPRRFIGAISALLELARSILFSLRRLLGTISSALLELARFILFSLRRLLGTISSLYLLEPVRLVMAISVAYLFVCLVEALIAGILGLKVPDLLKTFAIHLLAGSLYKRLRKH